MVPFVLCTYLRSDFLTSTSEQVGTISDRECALWIVLVEKPRGLALPRIVFWMPYIVIDTSIGMATGREIWGFRKEIGPVTIPSAEQDPARFVAQDVVGPLGAMQYVHVVGGDGAVRFVMAPMPTSSAIYYAESLLQVLLGPYGSGGGQ